MPKVNLYNMEGASLGELDLSEKVFGAEANEAVVHEVVVAYLAGLRRGTSSTKSRGEVRGGGRKPWRQKGTGRARVGTIRSPLWRGGSIIFGPKPRSYKKGINKKKVLVALRSALSAKVAEDALIVLDELTFDAPKTKDMLKVLDAVKSTGKFLLVLGEENETVIKSARNIPGSAITTVNRLTTYDVLHADKLIITKDALAKVEEVLA
ncbi:50S ribosomal protein L4 [Peptococcus simiae]|uniref:Large ribosomal subunit protein uL4 n=1 Tax=Peptococcus simiae TaxID=1643805 RepID=A0ABW9GW72_9FIRM